ncbi:cupin domain-containing protein [Crocosphaera sp. XPORK-15E]|uniref:cupin domain-containing protein n=1 Tax=Crocosphaera sp. XPORK-15E TaxID=3110247 RepID=UPI002B20B79E|nr:cupin domain-containing protein [Crocosphaera sp. XPORK-15E]MEA5536960.1 cupin domain-containing protein [Crocosphaera sp. XPORK-15E]
MNCKFFPQAQIIKVSSDVELTAFNCSDIVVQLAKIAPNAVFPLHKHPESQIGMLFSGQLEMNINGTKTMIEPLQQVYIAQPNILHGSLNPFSEIALGFDVKRIIKDQFQSKLENGIFQLTTNQYKNTNFSCQSLAGSWFEVLVTQIQQGEKIPIHSSEKEQIGIIINGELTMTVDNQKQSLKYGTIYYVPPHLPYSGYNSSDELVSLIEISINKD